MPPATKNEGAQLLQVEEKLKKFPLFSKLTQEKLEELADAIYMAALRAGLPLETAIIAIRSSSALRPDFFNTPSGCVFDFIEPTYRDFARKIFVKRAGGGTPNAAMGKAELLLLLFSDRTEKPVRGDILYEKRKIEIKTNGGKVGLGIGMDANKAVVAHCRKHGIVLRNSKAGKAAKGQPMFDPTKEEDRRSLGKNLPAILGVWWRAISGESMSNPNWPKVRRKFLGRVASDQLVASHSELLVLAEDGQFRFFKSKLDFVKYYNQDRTRYEYRGYQKNPFSIYLDVWPVEQKTVKSRGVG